MVQPPEDDNENQPQDAGNQDEEQDTSSDATSGEGEEGGEDIPAYPDDDDLAGSPPGAGEGGEDIPAYPDDDDLAGLPGKGGEEIPAYPDDDELAGLPFGFGTPYGYGGQPDPYEYPDEDTDLYGMAGDMEPAEETDRKGFALRLTQDTMLLILVLLFFVIAGISTIIFTTSRQDPSAPIAQTTPSATRPAPYPSPGIPGITPTQRPDYPAPGEGTRTPTAGRPGQPGYPEPNATQQTATALARTTTATAGPGTQVATTTGVAGQPGYPGPEQTAAPGGTEEPYPVGRTPTSVAQVPTRTPRPLPTRVPPTRAPVPTRVPPPTEEPTSLPFPTEDIEPTFTPEPIGPTSPPPPVVPPPPAELPYDQMAGDQRWTAAQSPIVVPRSLQLTPGSVLIIEPGVEVRLAQGVSINVDGAQLLALGQPGQPVRFISQDSIGRWEAIYGLEDSFIVLEHTEMSGGGSGGTLLTSENGELAIRNTRIHNNGGAILVNDSRLEMRESEIAGNDIPYGSALTASYSLGNFVTLLNNRIGGNRLSDGAVGVDISNFNTVSGVVLDVQGNLIRGGIVNLRLLTNGPLHGTVACNTLIGNQVGLGIRTRTLQVPAIDLTVANNYIAGHTPPIEPIYLDYGIGRGATSEVLLDMRNNWWGESSGPYHPEENPEGRGDAVGTNILYEPWLTSPPECTPAE